MSLKLAGYINLAMAMVMAGVFAIERQRENGWSVALVAVLGVVFARTAAQTFMQAGRNRAGA